MLINILSLFPEYFASTLACSILQRAQRSGLVTYRIINIRDFALDKHHMTDDRPFGGGPGMVMMVEPIDLALKFVKSSLPDQSSHRSVLMSAKGTTYTQETARSYAELDALSIVCGHYEGVDERVAKHLVDMEVRIGDFVLTGGEPAAAVIVDSVVRLLPGALGNAESTVSESHDSPGKLGFPQFTRPAVYQGLSVPEVLLAGDHKKIQEWRDSQRE